MSNAVAIVIVFAITASAGSQESTNDAKALEGKWLVVTAELGGTAMPKEVTQTMRLSIMGEKYAFTEGKALDQGMVKIDGSKKPKAMDIIGGEGPNKGKTFLAIYDLQGDTLRVCYDLTGKARPSEFATKKGGLLFLATYQRMK
jgi:uncharacterized protein (TIGR03067 family)